MTSPAPSSVPDAVEPPAPDLRFPMGRLAFPDRFDAAWRAQAIGVVADTPRMVADAVAGWSDAQLDTPYRPGGWTGRQVVHHMADSHINAYTRFKLALTEQEPTIKPYDEAAWASLQDSFSVPIAVSLTLLDALHVRWVALLHAMTETDFQRTLMHPENGRRTLDQMLATYAWHGPHHAAHLTGLRDRMGW